MPEALLCPIRAAAQTHPDAPALTGAVAVNYAAFDDLVSRYAAVLYDRGFVAGESVLFSARPTALHCALFWALLRVGCIACPVHPAMPAATRRNLVGLLRPEHEFVDEESPTDMHMCSLNELERESRRIQPHPGTASIQPDAPATVVLTSGSSGHAKAALLTAGNHLRAADAANANLPLQAGDSWLLSLPLHHVSGTAVLFRCAAARAAVALPPPGASLPEAVRATRPTHISVVPAYLARLLDSPESSEVCRCLKAALLGGAPTPPVLIRRACAGGIPLISSYGMTETAAQLCATPPNGSVNTLLSSGTPLIPDTVRIRNGGIETRGPALFRGYLREDGGLELPLTSDGWFRTGDAGYWDDAGMLHVTGRLDAMFFVGGENVHPEEIEAALLACSGITAAVAVPIPDNDYGALPVAFVASAHPVEERRLRDALKGSLPPFKIPRRFLPWPEHMAQTDKVRRSRFLEEAIQRLAQSNPGGLSCTSL